MKKKIVILGAFFLLAIFVGWTHLYLKGHQIKKENREKVTLTKKEVNDALQYGVTHKDDFLTDFQKPWTVFLGYKSGEGKAIIYTPFHTLALMARNSARENLKIDAEQLYKLSQSKTKYLWFELVLYGNEINFDRDCKITLFANQKEYTPLKSVHLGYDQAREYTISALRNEYFPLKVLEDKEGKLTLQVTLRQGQKMEFVFDRKIIP